MKGKQMEGKTGESQWLAGWLEGVVVVGRGMEMTRKRKKKDR